MCNIKLLAKQVLKLSSEQLDSHRRHCELEKIEYVSHHDHWPAVWVQSSQKSTAMCNTKVLVNLSQVSSEQ